MSLYVEKVWRTNRRTNGRTNGQTDLCIELRYVQLKRPRGFLWNMFAEVEELVPRREPKYELIVEDEVDIQEEEVSGLFILSWCNELPFSWAKWITNPLVLSWTLLWSGGQGGHCGQGGGGGGAADWQADEEVRGPAATAGPQQTEENLAGLWYWPCYPPNLLYYTIQELPWEPAASPSSSPFSSSSCQTISAPCEYVINVF